MFFYVQIFVSFWYTTFAIHFLTLNPKKLNFVRHIIAILELISRNVLYVLTCLVGL